jgi:hypothetical protein
MPLTVPPPESPSRCEVRAAADLIRGRARPSAVRRRHPKPIFGASEAIYSTTILSLFRFGKGEPSYRKLSQGIRR